MGRRRRPRLRALAELLAESHPTLEDPIASIRGGEVTVNGIVTTNPASLVPAEARVTTTARKRLRGEAKLEAALARFDVSVQGKVALDVGAAAGGFTKALLAAGAAHVFAVDAGHGQLLGSLRQDARVTNLEATNLGALDSHRVPTPIGIVTLDLSYLPLRLAVPQLARVRFDPTADAIALVKPQFELGLGAPPLRSAERRRAVESACRGFEASGWTVADETESPVRGHRGAVEHLLHARRNRAERYD